jgi:hypothetical protein
MAEKVTVHVGGRKIDVADATFDVRAQRTDLGIPKMEVPIVSARVRINLNDEQNCDNAAIQELFKLSTEQKKADRIKQIKLEFWTDLSKQNAAVSYEFKGWISSFRTSNVAGERGDGRYNHFLEIEFTPDTTDSNFKCVNVGN